MFGYAYPKSFRKRCYVQQKCTRRVSKRIHWYLNVSNRIQTYPNVSKNKTCTYPKIVSKIRAVSKNRIQTYPNLCVSNRIHTYPNVSKICFLPRAVVVACWAHNCDQGLGIAIMSALHMSVKMRFPTPWAYPNVSNRIQTYPKNTWYFRLRIQTYPNVSIRIQTYPKIQDKRTYPKFQTKI